MTLNFEDCSYSVSRQQEFVFKKDVSACATTRKWLPPPLRKLSQGKVEKGTPSTAPDRPTLKKTGSDKRFKLAHALPNVLKCFNQGYGHACDLVAAFYDQMLSWHQGVKMCY
uniref:Uncharacterized protein n=1 Tax=Timema poppense TaxID=170557 RepID=A0A7R9CNA7_TIMPO|nr:unnamed protein product [Timema poppensis]